MMEKRILSVKASDLLRDSLKYIKIRCDIDDNSREGARIYQQCMQIWAKYFSGAQMQLLVADFGREYIDEKKYKFLLGGKKFTCHLLEQLEISAVTGGYFYLFHAPEAKSEVQSQMERFYIESWQIALMDAGRLWLERYLRRQQPENCHLSESFGPGFFGMEIEMISVMVNILQGELVGVRLMPDGMMKPAKSLAGMFLTGSQEFQMPSGDCQFCQGTGRCLMCRHYAGQVHSGELSH